MKITEQNIESILFDYAEGNLTDIERKELETYLNLHPQYKELLATYDSNITIEKPLNIVYDEKDDLFAIATEKKSKNIIIISNYIKCISGIAAMFLLFFAVKSFYNLQNTQDIANISEVKQINEQEIKNINDLKDFNRYNKPKETTINNNKIPHAFVNNNISNEESDTEEIYSKEELLVDNNINIVDDVSIEENKELFAENNASVQQEEQENKKINENNIVNEEPFVINNSYKSKKDELIRKGVNYALNTQPVHTAMEGLVKVVSHPNTKKVANLLTKKHNKKTKVIRTTTITTEKINA